MPVDDEGGPGIRPAALPAMFAALGWRDAGPMTSAEILGDGGWFLTPADIRCHLAWGYRNLWIFLVLS